MPASPLTESLVTDAMVKSVRRVYQTMAHRDVSYVGRLDAWDRTDAGPMVVGCVGFAGALNGLIYLAMSESYALETTAGILGMTVAETAAEGPDAVKDAMGEVTNMTAGGFKNVLCDLGHLCMLTLPTILRGTNVSLSAVKGAERHLFRFECGGSPIVVDLQMKTGG
ncbi:MAG: chemotaxis protein CheX [Opitutaceae bacterium]